jgi:hypothetical protein
MIASPSEKVTKKSKVSMRSKVRGFDGSLERFGNVFSAV